MYWVLQQVNCVHSTEKKPNVGVPDQFSFLTAQILPDLDHLFILVI